MDREYPDTIFRFQRKVSQKIKGCPDGVDPSRIKKASIDRYKPFR